MTVKISEPQITLDDGREITVVITAANAAEMNAQIGVAIKRLAQLMRNAAIENGLAQNAVVLAILTPRECQVAQLIMRGQSNKDVARALRISDNTVEAHLRHIFDKLDLKIRTRTQLAILLNGQGGGG